MKSSIRSRFCGLLVVLATTNVLSAPKNRESMETSCHQFVQAFYDCYAPIADASANPGAKSESPVLHALTARRDSVIPRLRQLLIEDESAQSKANEIVRIDYDPFLFSQDPCERYAAEKVTIRNDRCFVEVHAICQRQRRVKADVTPELGYQNAHWAFLDFHYGQSSSGGLLNNLKALQRERTQGHGGAK